MHPETIHIVIGFIITLIIIIPVCHAATRKPMCNARRRPVKKTVVTPTIRKW